MKHLFQWAVALVIAATVTSCTVHQEFSFKEGYSGKSVNTVDLSTMRLLLPKFDSSRTFTDVQDSVLNYTRRLADTLKRIDGVRAVDYDWNDSAAVMRLSYRFSNLESLNKAFLVTNPGKCNKGKTCFSHRWRRFAFHAPHFINEKELQEIAPSERNHFQYTLDLVFPKAVRGAEGQVKVSKGKRRVSYRGNLLETFSKDSRGNFDIKTR